MLTFTELTDTTAQAEHSVALTYHQRVKSRLRIETAAGNEAGIVLERGLVLSNGDKLRAATGEVLEIIAAKEHVSVASCDSTLLFARACYHVGNRHAEVQIEQNRIIYLHDHVLDEMLTLLGLSVTEQQLPFVPESGAYSKGHSHTHSHHNQGSDDEHSHT